MKQIFKYSVESLGNFEVEMPTGAQILTVQTQGAEPVLWAEVNPENEMEVRKFRVIGTGKEIADDGERVYVGTFQMVGGGLIWHLFETL